MWWKEFTNTLMSSTSAVLRDHQERCCCTGRSCNSPTPCQAMQRLTKVTEWQSRLLCGGNFGLLALCWWVVFWWLAAFLVFWWSDFVLWCQQDQHHNHSLTSLILWMAAIIMTGVWLCCTMDAGTRFIQGQLRWHSTSAVTRLASPSSPSSSTPSSSPSSLASSAKFSSPKIVNTATKAGEV